MNISKDTRGSWEAVWETMFNIMGVVLKHSSNSQGSQRTGNRIQHSQNTGPRA